MRLAGSKYNKKSKNVVKLSDYLLLSLKSCFHRNHFRKLRNNKSSYGQKYVAVRYHVKSIFSFSYLNLIMWWIYRKTAYSRVRDGFNTFTSFTFYFPSNRLRIFIVRARSTKRPFFRMVGYNSSFKNMNIKFKICL